MEAFAVAAVFFGLATGFLLDAAGFLVGFLPEERLIMLDWTMIGYFEFFEKGQTIHLS